MPHSPSGPISTASPSPASPLFGALERITREEPLARKLLVAADVNWGRELLFAMARRTGGWIGWEPCTLGGLARELAFVELGRSEKRIGSDIEIAALADRALERAIAERTVQPQFGELAGGLGFRRAVRDALLEVRMAGLDAAELTAGTAEGTAARDLAAVLVVYQRLLDGSGLVDPAGAFRLALDAFDTEAQHVLSPIMVLAPGLRAAGLPGQLLRRLLNRGARPLPSDHAVGLTTPRRSVEAICAEGGIEPLPTDEVPGLSLLSFLPDAAALLPHEADGTVATEAVELDLFRAATPSDEIRQALRMALHEGLRWDEIELVATDTDTYGIALDAICGRLDVAHSSLHGVPFARTRLGRALERWFAWIGDGLPADALREALEAGDLVAPEGELPGTSLARLLRSLKIGWGRSRYDAALSELGDPGFVTRLRRRDDEADDEYAARLQQRAATARELSDLLERLLQITPAVPERGSADTVVLSAPILAKATLDLLELVPVHGAAEPLTMGRLRSRLDELAQSDEPATTFSTALAQLRDGLSDLRAWTVMGSDAKPWSSAGGRVHLTDLQHAGTTGRKRTFVMGLDADRVGGARVQNPIINDAAREAIGSDGLPTSSAQRDERAWMTARSLARLRSRITLSYSIGTDSDDRPVGPAHLLLQAHRLVQRNPSLTYSDLEAALGTPACPVPAADADALDRREVWLAALADGPLLLDGEAAVRAAYPRLEAGLRARQADDDDLDLTPYHGLVPAAAGEFDPRRSRYPISPTSLELLAKCPLAWFYRYGLNIQPTDDPEYDPETWLDPADRGSLLHELYETFGREYQGRQSELGNDAARQRILELTEEAIARWRAEVPPPSEAVFATEAVQLRQAALVFLESARGDNGEWIEFELAFRRSDPASFPLGNGGELRITGKIDRVDRLHDRKLRVIDYKTGKPGWYEPGRTDGPLKGGRTLQAALYAAAAEQRCNGKVESFEYRFPTPAGENRTVPYGPHQFQQARSIVEGLLNHPAAGEFLPTTEPSDCKLCEFQDICRVQSDTWSLVSPRAEWAAEHAPEIEQYAGMLRRRSPGGA